MMPRLSNAQKLSRVGMHKAAQVLALTSYRELRPRCAGTGGTSKLANLEEGSKARTKQLIGTFEQSL